MVTRSALPPVWLAPMVDGSELAFRMLCREHGAATAYSPMVRAGQILASPLPPPCTEDRPLVVQLCGNEPSTLGQAVRALISHYGQHLDGVDLNLGCPQQIAEKERIGAFLAEGEPELAVACVRAMAEAAGAGGPRISCKIRLVQSCDDVVSVSEATLAFAQRLQAAGCGLLVVHCRQRTAKHGGAVDLDTARALVSGLRIPVVINGGIRSVEDAQATLSVTGAHAVMVAQGFLQNPRMMLAEQSSSHRDAAHAVALASEYLDFAERYPPPASSYVRKHLRWILRYQLMEGAVLDQNSNGDVQSEGGSKGEGACVLVKFAAEERGWRSKMWELLSRAHLLTTLQQFRQALALFCTLAGLPEAEIPKDLASLPLQTFRSVRYRSGESCKKKRNRKCQPQFSGHHLM